MMMMMMMMMMIITIIIIVIAGLFKHNTFALYGGDKLVIYVGKMAKKKYPSSIFLESNFYLKFIALSANLNTKEH